MGPEGGSRGLPTGPTDSAGVEPADGSRDVSRVVARRGSPASSGVEPAEGSSGGSQAGAKLCSQIRASRDPDGSEVEPAEGGSRMGSIGAS